MGCGIVQSQRQVPLYRETTSINGSVRDMKRRGMENRFASSPTRRAYALRQTLDKESETSKTQPVGSKLEEASCQTCDKQTETSKTQAPRRKEEDSHRWENELALSTRRLDINIDDPKTGGHHPTDDHGAMPLYLTFITRQRLKRAEWLVATTRSSTARLG